MGDKRRVFYHAEKCVFSEAFPDADGGAFEITDYSRPDRHDPSGKLCWFDWKLSTIIDESKLSAAPKRGDVEASAESPKKASASGIVNSDVLRDTRSALKKTNRSTS